jgi:hypothetical protein
MTTDSPSAPAFRAWLDDFFASYFRRRPVNATFAGVHEYDHLLPDVSIDGFEALRAESSALLSRLRSLPDEPLSPVERIDRTLAEGFLEISEWELSSPHFVHGNPSVYTGDALFGVLSLFLRPFAPLDERIQNAVERLAGIPAYLRDARSVLRSAPTAWTERAVRECVGARAFLGGGIDILCQQAGAGAKRLRDTADRAATAFAEFEEWLQTDLLRHPSSEYACGADVLGFIVQRAHCVETSLAGLEQYALDQIESARVYLRAHAEDFGAATPAEALAQLRALHPSVDRYYGAYGEVAESARAAVLQHRLVTWPDFPLEFVPQPEWAREAAPHLYFLFYRSPAPFDRVLPVQYLVTPIEPEMPDDEQQRRLESTNDSVIKLNHVVHHGGIGHHVQNWHASRAASRIGQMAATDCASRIALQCGGTMAEGWACYATELMDEVGFLTPLESYAERHARLRMAARMVADIRLHSGQWSLEETAAFYTETVGMPHEAAHSEAVKNSMFPGTALMYLLGVDQIHDLRHEMTQSAGATLDLQQFHDRFLSYGSIPVALVAREMQREVHHAER